MATPSGGIRKKDVKIGGYYAIKHTSSSRLIVIKIEGECIYGGWNALNLKTKRAIRIKSNTKLRYEVVVNPEWIDDVDQPGVKKWMTVAAFEQYKAAKNGDITDFTRLVPGMMYEVHWKQQGGNYQWSEKAAVWKFIDWTKDGNMIWSGRPVCGTQDMDLDSFLIAIPRQGAAPTQVWRVGPYKKP